MINISLIFCCPPVIMTILTRGACHNAVVRLRDDPYYLIWIMLSSIEVSILEIMYPIVYPERF
ncbi:hypothetical protein GBM01_03065 [Yersinia pseudotuberculosis]|nr:hypothetical protein [Yersinia pseudotuberculosis]